MCLEIRSRLLTKLSKISCTRFGCCTVSRPASLSGNICKAILPLVGCVRQSQLLSFNLLLILHGIKASFSTYIIMYGSQSATTASTASAVSSATTGILVTPSFGSLVNVKLGLENYLLWKAQIMPYLRGQLLLGYVDDSVTAPSKMIIITAEGGEVSQEINPTYQVWIQQDQIVLSVLLSSLSQKSWHKVWSELECMFWSQSRTRVTQIYM